MRKRLRINSEKGIGLLELMLSLAIIALLLVMATRYYSSAHGSQQLNAAVEAYHAIYAAAETYEANDPAGTPHLVQLVKENLLPQVFGGTGSLANPWGGGINLTVTPAGSGNPQSILITMHSVPATQCTALIASLAQTLSGIDTVGIGIDSSGYKTASEIKDTLSGSSSICGDTGDSNIVGVNYYN